MSEEELIEGYRKWTCGGTERNGEVGEQTIECLRLEVAKLWKHINEVERQNGHLFRMNTGMFTIIKNHPAILDEFNALKR